MLQLTSSHDEGVLRGLKCVWLMEVDVAVDKSMKFDDVDEVGYARNSADKRGKAGGFVGKWAGYRL